ncbi:MAG: DegQ family serine endoprotease [Lysobacterales bacterium]|jgi:serine protease Do|nr:MAG: DegQ family serine endoprotease [Xanthomonadales bacterium]
MSITSFVRKPLVVALLGATVALVPAAALIASRSAHSEATAGNASTPATETVPATQPVVTPELAAASTDFRTLVRRYGPAVVNVSVRADGATAARRDMPPGMDPDNPLFRHFGMPMVPPGAPAVRGEGSGFIVSADGVILTNAHVVDGAERVTVKLTDRREFEARVLGADEKSDVAVLKIEASDLPVVKIGNPSALEVGEWVVAIGAPFGFENSVTAGIVSAKGRNLPDDAYVPFIQTDVAVNPGNSGGPLFNLRGEVVGINSQIYSRSGGYQGVSFAIPIDVAMDVGRQLQADGHVTRGRLGVGIQELDQALAKSFGLDRPRGALVSNVEQGGPAAAAGVQEGDVILSFDGRAIDSAGELPSTVAAVKPGREVELEVWRDGKSRNLSVKLGGAEAAEVVADGGAPARGRLGLRVRPAAAGETGDSKVERGLVVEEATGPAAAAGIQPGDVVLSANGRPVREVEDLRTVVADSKELVALLVQRGSSRIFVPVELG